MGRTLPVKGGILTAVTQVKNKRGVLPLFCCEIKDDYWLEMEKLGERRYDETLQIAAKLWIENHAACAIFPGKFGLPETAVSHVLSENGWLYEELCFPVPNARFFPLTPEYVSYRC